MQREACQVPHDDTRHPSINFLFRWLQKRHQRRQKNNNNIMSCQKHTSQPSTSRSVTLKLCLSNGSLRIALRNIRFARLAKLLRSYEIGQHGLLAQKSTAFRFLVNPSQNLQIFLLRWQTDLTANIKRSTINYLLKQEKKEEKSRLGLSCEIPKPPIAAFRKFVIPVLAFFDGQEHDRSRPTMRSLLEDFEPYPQVLYFQSTEMSKAISNEIFSIVLQIQVKRKKCVLCRSQELSAHSVRT